VSRTEYLAALAAAGLPPDLPKHELDRRAAELLRVGERTARSYRSGQQPVPGPVSLALELLARRRKPTRPPSS
jgi:hypothetical protein